ncbi:MAG: PorT family protein [Tannerella sp.]|jgi:hypothetical protein|nr:PorT family protein [Tannerella sp.]
MKSLKYLFVLAVMFAAVSTANAQFRFGVKGGVSVSTVKFDKDVFNSDNVTGFHVGPSLEGMFAKGGLGFDVAVLYSQVGFDSDDETVKNDYLEVPVNLKFKFGTPIVNPYLSAGPYVAFRVAGDKTWDMNVSGVKEQIEAQSFGAGLNFSAGADVFKFLQVGVTYTLGLTDDYKTLTSGNSDDNNGKSRTWKISAAIYF